MRFANLKNEFLRDCEKKKEKIKIKDCENGLIFFFLQKYNFSSCMKRLGNFFLEKILNLAPFMHFYHSIVIIILSKFLSGLFVTHVTKEVKRYKLFILI